MNLRLRKPMIGLVLGGFIGGSVAGFTVSYTHLDVYKRQGWSSPKRGVGGSNPLWDAGNNAVSLC